MKASVITFVNQFANKNEDIYLQWLIASKPVQNIRNRNALENQASIKVILTKTT
jgi:hypothetical protein